MPRSDILILGGGIIGCALAEELARRDKKVTLLERGTIGAEASMAAAGILSAQTDQEKPGPLFDLCQESMRLYPRWIRRIKQASNIDPQLHTDGILYLAMTQAEAKAKARQAQWQKRRGLRVERWSHAEVRRKEPALSGKHVAAFFFPDEAQLDNAALMRALAIASRSAGASVWEKTTVQRFQIQENAVSGVETNRGRFRAPVVINCLGTWADLGGRFPQRLSVEPIRGQILMFEAPRKTLRHIVFSERGYAVQRRDGRLLAGSTLEKAGFAKALTVEGMGRILLGLGQLMDGQAAGWPLVAAWSGLRPGTIDDQPILGPTETEGLYVAAGHYRHGILLAPVTAIAIADTLTGRPSSIDLSPFSPLRFKARPPSTFKAEYRLRKRFL